MTEVHHCAKIWYDIVFVWILLAACPKMAVAQADTEFWFAIPQTHTDPPQMMQTLSVCQYGQANAYLLEKPALGVVVADFDVTSQQSSNQIMLDSHSRHQPLPLPSGIPV